MKQVMKMIEKKLLEEQFKETANIFVTVKLSGLKFTANGEVVTPGTRVLFQERVNIFEAIANVGDITVFGDKKDVLIIRQYPQGQKIHHLDHRYKGWRAVGFGWIEARHHCHATK